MSNKTFGKAPFKMNWKHQINTNDEPLKTLYRSLRMLNTLMKLVEGTKVTSDRYGLYQFHNNLLLAIHAYIKALQAKNYLLRQVIERQLMELDYTLNLIVEGSGPDEIKGIEKVKGHFRLYGSYILWKELQHYNAMQDPKITAKFGSNSDGDTFKWNGITCKDSDLASILFMETKQLISQLKLEREISHLDKMSREGENAHSFIYVLKGFTAMSGMIARKANLSAMYYYKSQSDYVHGTYNSLKVTDSKIIGGSEKFRGLENGFVISAKHIEILPEYQITLFRMFWSKEFEKSKTK